MQGTSLCWNSRTNFLRFKKTQMKIKTKKKKISGKKAWFCSHTITWSVQHLSQRCKFTHRHTWITTVTQYFEGGIHPTSPITMTSAEAKSGFRAAHFRSRKAKEQKVQPCNTLHWLHTSKWHRCGWIRKAKEDTKLSFAGTYQNTVTATDYFSIKAENSSI